MKIKKIDSIEIGSKNWRALIDWYKNVFDLEENMTQNIPTDNGANLIVGDGSVLLWFGEKNELGQENLEPTRMMIAFEIQDVYSVYEELVQKGVDFIVKPSPSINDKFYYMTIKDPDGNKINLYSFNKK